MNQYITVVAGKSGGHIIPGLTLAQHIQQQYPEIRIHCITTNTALDHAIVSQAHYVERHVALPLSSFSLRAWWKYPYYLGTLVYSCLRIIVQLLWYRPQRIISMGGLVSVPVVYLGWLLHIPVELYELNAVPGKAILATARCAQKVHVCFKQSQRYFNASKCVLSSYPIRFKQPSHSTLAARIALKLEPTLPTLLIVGGSQGSLWINNHIKKWIEQTKPTNFQIIHQTGAQDFNNWQSFYNEHRIAAQVFSFSNAIEHYYQAADVIVARAGAGTLFEIAHFNKQCIIIPLEVHTTNHQIDNAHAFAQDYPTITTVLLQQSVEKNNLLLFNALNYKLLHAAGLYLSLIHI